MTYLSAETLERKLEEPELNPMSGTFEDIMRDYPSFLVERFYAQCYLDMIRSTRRDFKGRNMNNFFPDVHPMQVSEFLETWWRVKSSESLNPLKRLRYA